LKKQRSSAHGVPPSAWLLCTHKCISNPHAEWVQIIRSRKIIQLGEETRGVGFTRVSEQIRRGRKQYDRQGGLEGTCAHDAGNVS